MPNSSTQSGVNPMELVYRVAQCSPDPRTKIGAVIVQGDVSHVFSNEIPKRFKDKISSVDLLDKEFKKAVIDHAECLAIAQMDDCGGPYGEPTLYVNETPCSECAKAIVAAGIKEVRVSLWWFKHAIEFGPDPYPKWYMAHRLFSLAGVNMVFDDTSVSIPARRDDLDFIPSKRLYSRPPNTGAMSV